MKSNYALRLQTSIKRAAERRAEMDGTTLNQFINVAVAEKLSALDTTEYFRERAARGSVSDFMKFLDMAGNEPPREGDER
jgi:uncharacterized protein (DUF1778 family)